MNKGILLKCCILLQKYIELEIWVAEAEQLFSCLLETAQELQIKGLQSIEEDERGQTQSIKTNSELDPKTEKKYIRNPDATNQESIIDPLEELTATLAETEDKLVLNTNLELDLQIEQMIEKNLGIWQCKVCAKTSKQRCDMKNHAETHIDGVTHACHICNKTCTTRKWLKVHIARNHS